MVARGVVVVARRPARATPTPGKHRLVSRSCAFTRTDDVGARRVAMPRRGAAVTVNAPGDGADDDEAARVDVDARGGGAHAGARYAKSMLGVRASNARECASARRGVWLVGAYGRAEYSPTPRQTFSKPMRDSHACVRWSACDLIVFYDSCA